MSRQWKTPTGAKNTGVGRKRKIGNRKSRAEGNEGIVSFKKSVSISYPTYVRGYFDTILSL
jgi:hypothetical protein